MDEQMFEVRYKKAILDCQQIIKEIDSLYKNYIEMKESKRKTIDLLNELVKEFYHNLKHGNYYDLSMIEFRVQFFKNEIKKLKK